MDWKDTVMKITKPIVDEYSHTERYEVGGVDNPITVRETEWDLNRLLDAQAELSFKAGINYVLGQAVTYGYLSTVNDKHGVHIPDELFSQLKEGTRITREV